MTRTNRTLNRVLLAVVGLLAIGSGATLAVPAARGIDALHALRSAVLQWLASAGDAVREPAVALPVALGGLAVAVLAMLVIATRGRGGTAVADSDADVEITIGAVRDIVSARLASVPAVLAVRADAHRLRGRTVISLTLSTRRRADLAQILARTRDAAAALDAAVGTRLPLVVRIRSGWRSTLARDQRAE